MARRAFGFDGCFLKCVATAGVLVTTACGGAGGQAPPPLAASGPSGASPGATAPAGAAPAEAATNSAAPGSDLTDGAKVAFRADFTPTDFGGYGGAWNVFGASPGLREVAGGPDGLAIRVVRADKAWDAVGARTSRVKLSGGDFDLRGHFRDFGGLGNVSAKLIVVDAKSPRGEAAYVERLVMDGKSVFKFGGEVQGSLEMWGLVPTEAKSGDLRLVRQGEWVQGFARTDAHGPWAEIGPKQRAPQSMPSTLKFGVKLSSGAGQSAQVRWSELTVDGAIVRSE